MFPFSLLDDAFDRGRGNLPGFDRPLTWRQEFVGFLWFLASIFCGLAGLTIAFGPWLYGAYMLLRSIF